MEKIEQGLVVLPWLLPPGGVCYWSFLVIKKPWEERAWGCPVLEHPLRLTTFIQVLVGRQNVTAELSGGENK